MLCKRVGGPCRVPKITGDRVIETGETIDVPEREAPGFYNDAGWLPVIENGYAAEPAADEAATED